MEATQTSLRSLFQGKRSCIISRLILDALVVLGGTCWIYTRSVCGSFAIDVEFIKFGITIIRNLRTGGLLLVGVLAFFRDGPSSFRLVWRDGLLALPSARHHDRVQPFCRPIRQRLPPHPGRLPLRPSTIRAQPLSCKTVNTCRDTKQIWNDGPFFHCSL